MVHAIIVAAGKGLRMNDALRKQYIVLEDIPILTRTLGVFNCCDLINRIILVLPEDDIDFCHTEIISKAHIGKEVTLISGGPERQDSVYNGLQTIAENDGVIVIHDGVRPFVRQQHLVACIKGAQKQGACIVGTPVFDTAKMVNTANEIIQTPERDTLWLAQTPQAFEAQLIKKAHETAKREGFIGTDDAALVERMGESVKIIPGSRSNIKITSQDDLILARAIVKGWSEPH